MDRREMVLGTMMAGASVMATQKVLASGSMKHSKGKHMHLRKTTAECIETGQSCRTHCIKLLSKGQKNMGECLEAVEEMLATVEATQKLAALDSSFLKAQAKICLDVCKACEEVCKKHAHHHKECAECATACKEWAEACKKVA